MRDVSTWEERMSARAQERIRAEEERERARIAAELAAEAAEMEERYRPIREAGPPGGCYECWHWVTHYFGHMWMHGRTVQPGPPLAGWEDTPDTDWCWHSCHGDEPRYCGVVGMAAAG